MRIQILNPANCYKPLQQKEVKDFIKGDPTKDGIVFKVTPGKDRNLRIVHEEPIALDFDDKAGLMSLGVSAHSDLYGLTWFSINEHN